MKIIYTHICPVTDVIVENMVECPFCGGKAEIIE